MFDLSKRSKFHDDFRVYILQFIDGYISKITLGYLIFNARGLIIK
jgi:hypothetical protein